MLHNLNLATQVDIFPESFEAFRTTKTPGSELDEIQEKYVYLGTMEAREGMLKINAPAGSVTTFFAK